MTRTRVALFGLVGLVGLVAVLASGGAYLVAGGAEQFRAPLSSVLSDAAGRTITLAGPLELTLFPSPTLVAGDLRAANPPWASRPYLVQIERMVVELGWSSLWAGTREIRRLELDGLDLSLERSPSGAANWATEGAEQAQGLFPALPALRQIRLRRGTVSYAAAGSGTVRRVTLDDFTVAPDESAGPRFNVALLGAYGDRRIRLGGTVGLLATFAPDGPPLPLDLTVDALGARWDLAGELTFEGSVPVADLAVRVRAGTLHRLEPLVGRALHPDLALDARARIRARAAVVVLEDFRARLGEDELEGALEVTLGREPAAVKGRLAAVRLDLTALLRPPDPAPAERTRFFSEEPFELGGLQAVDLELELSIDELITAGPLAREVAITLVAGGGQADLDPVRARFGDGLASGRASVDARVEPPEFALSLSGKDLDLGPLLNGTALAGDFEGTATVGVDLRARGRSAAGIAGSTSGQTRLMVSTGRARLGNLEGMVGGITTLLGTLTTEDSDWTRLDCLAADLQIRDGLVTRRTLLADTEFSTVTGEGSADLGQETLDLKVSPRPKSTTLNVAVPVRVGGTFLEPTFTPDELSTARRLGGLLGAVLFPPAALAAFVDLGTDDDHPCLTVAGTGGRPAATAPRSAEAPAPHERKASAGVGRPVEEPDRGAGGMLESIDRGLKGLFGGRRPAAEDEGERDLGR